MMATQPQHLIDQNDDALMAQVAARDTSALRLLADRHAEIAWRIAYRMLGDRQEAEDADETIEEDEVRNAVANCIEALPDRQRAAIVLTYYEERQNRMAAEILAMQVKAFESLLFRARGSLRDCVESKGVVA